ncbi:MAG: M48 family metallopeptidase [Candidatus Bathyarchaeota archaeon]|nr:M48 family metallopeptidase [Candidatus Bathyarchaeota archaeon]
MYSYELAFIQRKLGELAVKAKLETPPQLEISQNEKLASIRVFRRQITVGENFLQHWRSGSFDEKDVEATLAHELGHMMDFSRFFRSASFWSLLLERFYFALVLVPVLVCFACPSITSLLVSSLIFVCWALLLPWITRNTGILIEIEADKNAATYLVEPKQLADTLLKINALVVPIKKFGLAARLDFLAGMLTQPSCSERLKHLDTL